LFNSNNHLRFPLSRKSLKDPARSQITETVSVFSIPNYPIIVDPYATFALVASQNSAHVLNKLSFERQRKGEKERVHLRTIKAFAQVLAGGYGEKFAVRRHTLNRP
jgi:hypothetical protein